MTYMLQRGTMAQTPADEIAMETAQGVYTLVVTTTFSAQPDPFALTAGGEAPAALQIRMGSRVLLHKTDDIMPGRPMRVTIDEGLAKGTNELFIEASPPLDSADQAQAVRLQLLRDELTVAQDTFWADPGENISKTFRFDIEKRHEDTEHDH
jgi:anaerobic selenocysteine-containing dehydrogenase